jgi:hypothetical protein
MNGGLVMARQEYYPEYYLKKRQKDAIFNRIWKTVAVVVIVGLGVAAGYLVYKQIVEPRRQPSDNTTALAGLKGDLEAQERLNNAASQEPPDDVNETTRQMAQETNLDEIDYVQSFPQVHVSVAGSNQPVNRGTNGAASADPAGDNNESGSSAAGNDSQQQDAAESPAKEPEQKPKADDSARQGEESQPEEKPKPPKPAGPPTYEYKIYAGSYPSQTAADEGKRGLGALGLTGSIIKNGADYNLLVGTLTNFEAALALRSKLESSGYGGSFVTRKTK